MNFESKTDQVIIVAQIVAISIDKDIVHSELGEVDKSELLSELLRQSRLARSDVSLDDDKLRVLMQVCLRVILQAVDVVESLLLVVPWLWVIRWESTIVEIGKYGTSCP